MTTYSTRAEAIQREIVEPIEAGDATANEFDIDAIANEVLGGHGDGYACLVDHDEFWQAVKRHARQPVNFSRLAVGDHGRANDID